MSAAMLYNIDRCDLYPYGRKGLWNTNAVNYD